MTSNTESRDTARAYPVSDALHLRPGGLTNMQGLPYVMNQRIGPKKQVGNRIATWNVGMMTGKSMEVAEALKRWKVDVACIQEVKWKGKKGERNRDGLQTFLQWRE